MVTEGVMVTEPEVADAVKPEPVQEVAFVLLQERVEDPPGATEVGLAMKVAVVDVELPVSTLTFAVAEAAPAGPVQVIE